MEEGSLPAIDAGVDEYVVGVDGSLASAAAARWAADRAARDKASLVVVHAYQVTAPPSAVRPGVTRAMRRAARLDAERLLRSLVEQLPAGAAVQQVPVEGMSDEVLLERCNGAELLVLGARPRRNHAHARFVGSTATRCLRVAQCPVVLVPGIHTEDAATRPPVAATDDERESKPISLGRT